MRRWFALVMLVAGTVTMSATQVWAAGVSPVAGPVVEVFNKPANNWLPGHRGVDLAAPVGTSVVAPTAGVVSFVGRVAERPVVVITHGDLRSTLEPVTATVTVGQQVREGDIVGRLEAGHSCAATSCLHWGLKRGEDYLDPLSLLDVSSVRLLPSQALAQARQRAQQRQAVVSDPADDPMDNKIGTGKLSMPVQGRLGSRFGMRFHPIFHQWRMHSGIDLSAPCGTPLHAAADGVVSHVGFDSSGGWRLIINHGQVLGAPLSTVYLHAQGYRVRVGQHVKRGELVGWVGTTGWSTGCHLHFTVKHKGRAVDPLPWLR